MKLFFTLLTFIFLFIFSYAQQVTFEKHYNFGATENGFSVTPTFDGGYCVSGDHRINLSSSYLLLMKTDSLGVIEWTKFIGPSTNSNEGYDIKQTPDSGYIITGETDMIGSIYLAKTNKNGDTLWTKNYGTTVSDVGQCVQPTFDGGYVIAGGINDTACIVKTDSVGNLLWIKKFIPQGAVGSKFNSFIQTNDSGFIFTGTISFPGIQNIYVVRSNSIGDTLWTRIYNRSPGDYGFSIDKTFYGGYIVGGTTWQGSYYVIYVLDLNSSGDTLWTKTYNNGDGAIRAIQLNDRGFIFFCQTETIGVGSTDFYLIRTDSIGDTLWTRTFGGYGIDAANDMKLTTDGGFIMVGSSDGTSYPPQGGIYLVKTDSSGNIAVGITEINSDNSLLEIFPNPSNGKFNIKIHDSQIRIHNLEIYDVFGEKIYSAKEGRNISSQTINISANPDGIYLLNLCSNKETISKKVIIQK